MDDIVTQMGLLLTQTRFARRALEDIERTTSRYGAFTVAMSNVSGAAFGDPPMLDGALRVHVVNIRDIAPGSGFGDSIAGLFGGIGAFLGNLVGGAVGGTVGSVFIALSLDKIDSLLGRIERIMDRLGLSKAAATPAPAAQGAPVTDAVAAAAPAAAAPPAPSAGGQLPFLTMLSDLRDKLNAVTTLLQVANGPATPGGAVPGGAVPGGGTGAPSAVAAPDAQLWRDWVDSLTAALQSAGRLVAGLIIAIPTAISALSWLLDRLPELRNAITETMRFIVRNALLLRGVVIVLAFETIAMILRVAELAVRSLATAVKDALAALFAALGKLLDAALELGGVLAKAMVDTVKQLLDWLVPVVYKILFEFGELRLFKVIEKLVDGLPLLYAVFGGKEPPKPAGTGQNPPVEGRPPTPPTLPRPDISKIVDKAQADAKAALNKLTGASKELVDKPTDALRTGLTDFAKKLDEAAAAEVKLSDTTLAKHLEDLGKQADKSADMLLPVTGDGGKQNVWDRLRGQSAFHPIAAAYGQWLATGGLGQLLDSMTTYFATPQSGSPTDRMPAGADGAPVVRIDEVIIDIAPRDTAIEGPAGTSSRPTANTRTGFGTDLLERHAVEQSLARRRGSMGQPPRHVPIFDFDELD